MNVKAERMEQMIQVVNRNLQLVFSGEPEGMVEHMSPRNTYLTSCVFPLQVSLHWKSENWKRWMR
jgi:hypothetical protein